MFGGGLSVGSVMTKVGFQYDRTEGDHYDRDRRKLALESSRAITQDVRVDYDERGMGRYQRSLADADRGHASFARGTGRLRGALGTLSLGMGAATIGLGVLATGAYKANQAFEESQQISRQTAAVLKSTGGAANVTAKEVANLARQISLKTGIDDEAIQSSENLLLTFTHVRNEAGKGNDIFTQATRTIQDMSVALGQDGSSSAIQLGKALNDPIKGITALQRVGVSFTQGQRDQIKTLVEHGNTLKAQQMILRELNKEFGGSAEAAATGTKKMSVAFGNVVEWIGGKLNPAFNAAGNAISKFVDQAQRGVGAGGAFVKSLRGGIAAAGAVLKTLVAGFRATFDFVASVIAANHKTIDSIATNIGRAVGMVKRVLAAVGAAFKDAFGDGSQTGQSIRQIIAAVLKVFDVIQKVALGITGRALPGIIAAFRGMANVIKGVINVIAGILTLNFGKVWDGIKQIFSGGIQVVVGFLRSAVGVFGGIASMLGRAISKPLTAAWNGIKSGFQFMVQFLKDRLSDVLGVFSSILNAASHLPIIGGKFRDAARSIDAMRASLQSAADVARGTIAALDALASAADRANAAVQIANSHPILHAPPSRGRAQGRTGGTYKGPGTGQGAFAGYADGGIVGPGHGGLRAFIAGEGAMPEWVISQEGDRQSNIRWAIDALRTLTGRGVELHATGKGPKLGMAQIAAGVRGTKDALAGVHTKHGQQVNRGIQHAVARKIKGLGGFDDRIANMERAYQQKDREYGLSVVDLLVQNDDGSVTVDTAAQSKRAGNLQALTNMRVAIRDEIQSYIEAARAAITAYQKAIRQLQRALKAATGKSRAKERGGYRDLIGKYSGRVGELNDVISSLGFDKEDSRLDLLELGNELGEVLGTKGTPAPSTDAGSSGDTSAGDTGTGSSSDVSATPDPNAVAQAALAQLAAFNAARSDLFSSYGRNFAAAGTNPFAGAGLAAGYGFFGAATGGPASGSLAEASGGGVHITQHFAAGPDDPLSWTAGVKHELQALS